MSTIQTPHEKVQVTVQCVHSILNTAWPRPGVSAVSNSSVFIGTNVFIAFENGVRELVRQLDSLENRQTETEKLKDCTNGILKAIEALKRHKTAKPTSIDAVVNLMYLLTGGMYELVAQQFDIRMKDERFIAVEEFPFLVQICKVRLPVPVQDVCACLHWMTQELDRQTGQLAELGQPKNIPTE